MRARRSYKDQRSSGFTDLAVPLVILLLVVLVLVGCIAFVLFPIFNETGNETNSASTEKVRFVDLTQPFSSWNKLNVAVMILLTKDPGSSGGFLDGAGTLAYSIEEAHSIHDLTLRALVHESVTEETCDILRFLGYEIVRKDLPVQNDEIQNEVIRKQILTDGCCGMSELLKLWVWTWEEFDVVLTLDADMVFHSNFDIVFDILYRKVYNSDMEISKVNLKYPPKDPKLVAPTIDPLTDPFVLGWTHGASAETGNELMNGGFLVVRPNVEDFVAMCDILKEGDFRNDGSAWRGSGVAWTYGARTIQGLVPYYYFQIRPDAHVEIPRCLVNNMAEIEKCRKWSADRVISNHFTWCQKPWYCVSGQGQPVCDDFNTQWWAKNRRLEEWLGLSKRQQCPNHKYVPINWKQSPKFQQWKSSDRSQ